VTITDLNEQVLAKSKASIQQSLVRIAKKKFENDANVRSAVLYSI